jgi:glycosyltransferase involved in cell wall biosynthesis
MREILVSIVLPVFNGEKFLEQSIKSCLAQTHTRIELIIINDCSTDSSLKIAKSFALKDERVKVYSNKRNLNLPASLNVGHAMSNAQYISWTSDDNFYESNAIEIMLEGIITNGVDIVYSNFNIIEKDEIARFKDVWTNSLSLLLGNNVGTCFLYKKDVFIRNGGYDENLHTIEDYDFWLQASVHSTYKHIPHILYNYRKHENSLTSQIKPGNSNLSISFQEKLNVCYLKFFKSYNLEDQFYPDLFKKLHLNQKIDVYNLLKRYSSIKKDLKPIFKRMNEEEILEQIDIKIRGNIYNFPQNQNLNTLFKLIKERPVLLLKYGKRKSLKIILRSLS